MLARDALDDALLDQRLELEELLHVLSGGLVHLVVHRPQVQHGAHLVEPHVQVQSIVITLRHLILMETV